MFERGVVGARRLGGDGTVDVMPAAREYGAEVAAYGFAQVVAVRAVQASEQRLVQSGPLVQAGRVRHRILRPRADVVGQHVGERLPDDPLLLAVAEFQVHWQAHRQLHDRRGRGTGPGPRLRTPCWRGPLAATPYGTGCESCAGTVGECSVSVGVVIHRVAAEQFVGTVAGQHDLHAEFPYAAEQRHRHDRVDDVAVLAELGNPDRFADVGQSHIARSQFDDLVRHAEVGREPAGVREIFATGCADGERDAVRVELLHVQQRERAVEPSGKDHPNR